MDKKKTHFKLKFKFRLFLYVTAVFIIIGLLVSCLFSETAYRNARRNETLNSRMVAERISSQVESLYRQMDVAATSITKNSALQNIVLNLNLRDSTESKKQFTEELEKTRTIQKTLLNLMFSPTISNVFLYNKDLDYLYYTGLYLPDKALLERSLKNSKAAKTLKDSQEDRLYLKPHLSPWINQNRAVLSVIRNFSDYPATSDSLVEVQVPCSQLDDICCQDAFGNEKQIVILDSDFQQVYPYNEKVTLLSPESMEAVTAHLKAGNLESYGRSYAYYASPILNGRFYVTLLSDQSSLRQYRASNARNVVLTVLLILTAACTIIFAIISFVSRPLKEMISYINDLSLAQDASLRLSSDFLDEFELINHAFNQMVEKLKESIKQTYDARLRESNANLAALQAQINPHFLYNALNSISAASEIYGSQVTTRMCQQFSSMMRYVTLANGQASLAEELGHTRNYLDFMKLSYDGSFDYGICLSPEMQNLFLPRLTIQPLVENSFKHGFKECLPPYRIHIQCMKSDGKWSITITDNGSGFSNDALNAFQEFKTSWGLNARRELCLDLDAGGLGLKNIYGRLASSFQGIEFIIANRAGQTGCSITIRGKIND